MVEDTRLIRIATDDRTFLSDLQAARIEGLNVSRRLQASGTEQGLPFLLAVEIAKVLVPTVLPLLVAWLHNRSTKKPNCETQIDGVRVTNDIKQITVIVMGDQIIQQDKGSPAEEKKQERVDSGHIAASKTIASPTGRKRGDQ
ncbi:MAG: hypothetical protein ACHQ9S_24230 [Candidatus Binatia bacterium]